MGQTNALSRRLSRKDVWSPDGEIYWAVIKLALELADRAAQ